MKPAHTDVPAPVSVSLLLLVVHEDGTLAAILDQVPVAPPVGVEAWRRSMFGQIVDQVTNGREVPVRVEVRESDGTSFTDILPAAKRTPKHAPEPPKPAKKSRPADPILVDGGDGFIAGEDVAVAIITGHTDASHEGHVRALLDPKTITATEATEVLLVGRVSGAVAIRGLS